MNIIPFLRKIEKYFGNVIIFFLSFFTKEWKKETKIKKILVIRLWTLGESLLLFPMLKKLNDEGYKVDVLVSKRNYNVFKDLDFINKVLIVNLRNILKNFKKYDIVIDSEPYFNSSAILGYLFGKNEI